MTDLAYLTAAEALRRFADRSLSPVELLDAVIARAAEVEPAVNAFCFTRYDEARAEAKAAEDRWMRGEARPLEGIPTAFKDESPVAGQPWSMGSLIYRDLVAEETSPLMHRLLDAGVVQHARTTTPEFSCAGFTHSRVHGVTRNPWNPEFGVGGSSGGSGASLAAGSSTLATGSDIGGSIRIPASFNGVVGFKAPHGRVPCEPPFGLDMYCHNGGLARTVEDMRLFQNALAGPHPMDHRSLRPKLELGPIPDSVAGMRIAYTLDFGGTFPIDPDVARETLAALDALRAAGAVIEEAVIVIDRPAMLGALGYHFAQIFGAWIATLLDEHKDEMTDYTLAFIDRFRALEAGTTGWTQVEAEAAIWSAVAPILETHDALLCPTSGTRGFVAGDGYADHGLEVGGQETSFYFDALLTPVFNILSACPVLNVPSGIADNGVPTGLQIVGRTFDDATTFQIGAALERERPWLDTPARRPMQSR